ncbi:EAP30/Vps36 family [Nesidiocoris tenuis]|uniref:Vacuolar-sorting protein SNF8 n=1 Tax=Nesidiocoris tenuis TaxID=355587 RepID=A0ABN7ATP0_9HEMI|nr:EAP30/Vps36 family [Nesidiocoris tenuis]
MRRRAGIGAIQKQKLEQEKFKDKGTELHVREFEVLSKQLEQFRQKLEEFAAQHRAEIKRNPVFRRQFQEMCAAIGVDPLASNKGFWSVLNLGDFYYELSVQIVEVCLATSEKNGGLISLDELRTRLLRSRGRVAQEVTIEDILTASKKLGVFGSGFQVLQVPGGRTLIRSVPGELSVDVTSVLSVAPVGGGQVNQELLAQELGWTADRASAALDAVLADGLAWIDTQASPTQYWFPSLFIGCMDC